MEENYAKVEKVVLNTGFDYAGGLYHNNPNFIGLREPASRIWTGSPRLDWNIEAQKGMVKFSVQLPLCVTF